mmetsp:Transcript_5892/g.14499  ORF Transcript_5892/g.14499 Transcript_5892/m.14499 type:complete len:84 (+) Transcript_5892:4940-5191(+)
MAASSYREVQNQSKANKQNEEKRLDFAPEKTKTGVKINQSTNQLIDDVKFVAAEKYVIASDLLPSHRLSATYARRTPSFSRRR